MEKPAEIEEEEDVVPEKLQEELEKKAEPPSPQKVVIEKKPIVPFMMGGRGFVALPCQVIWALADSMVDETAFQSRRQGNQRSAQYEALQMQCAPTLGFRALCTHAPAPALWPWPPNCESARLDFNSGLSTTSQ